MRRFTVPRLLVVITLSLLVAPPLAARVVRVVIDRRELVMGGQPFGGVGPYEKLVGRVFFAFDPENPANARIVDLDLAPRNEDGLVEAWADFMVLRPVNGGRGVALLEVSNRGGKASLSYFNAARGSADPTRPEHFGDGLLMRLGLTVIWVGWQHDVPARADRLRLHVPVATRPDGPITGLVRSDWTVDRPADTLDVAHRNHVPYPVSDPDDPDNVLTMRNGRLAPREVIPRRAWRFTRDGTRIVIDGGFEAGRIYELVYRARDPKIVGLGLAAIRDMISYAKYDSTTAFPVRYGIAIGISQTGRFLRHYLYQGFNVDEDGRTALDGVIAHTAGAGRGSFNHRFAQPSRDAHRYSAFFYPTDIFPFTSRTQTDPVSGWTDGLLARTPPAHRPKTFFTNTGYEYWGRAAALIHITPDGQRDVPPLDNERIYHLASGQHFVSRFPPPDRARVEGSSAYRGNPLNFLLTMRALLVRMVEWVADDAPPPPSTHPTIAEGSLVPISVVRFPAIPGVTFPSVAHEAYRADYGPRWSAGIVDRQPPELGPAFPVLVPQVDSLGNEIGGIPSVEILAPLATYTPWSLRAGFAGGSSELMDFLGMIVPLPKEPDEPDPRPAISERYADRTAYLAAAERAARDLVARGFLLPEDVDRALERAGETWDWVMRTP